MAKNEDYRDVKIRIEEIEVEKEIKIDEGELKIDEVNLALHQLIQY